MLMHFYSFTWITGKFKEKKSIFMYFFNFENNPQNDHIQAAN